MVKRIALVGSSSTGKSTVFELLKLKLPKYEFIDESTRTVASFGIPINEQGTDVTQLAISSFHLSALIQPFNLVLDRCYLDVVVYSEELPVEQSTRDFINSIWKKIYVEYTHYIYFPIEFKAVEDGVRSVNEEWREKIDNTFKKYLNEYNLNYLTVSGSPKQRIDQILNFINK